MASIKKNPFNQSNPPKSPFRQLHILTYIYYRINIITFLLIPNCPFLPALNKMQNEKDYDFKISINNLSAMLQPL